MKKILALLALVLGVVSCQTEPEGLDVNVGGEVETTVCVSLPEATRANSAVGAFDNGVLGTESDATTIRYILQVFQGVEENGDTTWKASKETKFKYSDGKSVTFDVRLVPNRNYKFVVWADVVTNGENDTDNHYNTHNGDNGVTDLTKITLNNTWVAMDESRDAFTGVELIEEYTSQSTINVELKRPFAKLRVKTTDVQALKNLDITPAKATVSYSSTHYTTFDALNGSVSGQLSDKSHTMFDIAEYRSTNGELEEGILFTDYFFAAEQQESVQFQLYVYEDERHGSELIKYNNFSTEIAVRRNYLTTIQGNILTDGNNVTVEVKDAFENANKPTDEPYYYQTISSEAELRAAINGQGGEYIVVSDIVVTGNSASTLAATRAAGDTTINLNGYTITLKADIEVESGKNITITDINENGEVGAIVSENGGAIVNEGTLNIEGGSFGANTIENNNGVVNITGGTISQGAITGDANITGGEFTYNPENEIPDGYKVVETENGKYEVRVGDPIAKIGNETYTTLQAAFDAAEGETTIVLLSDATFKNTSVLAEGKTVILDLGEHTLSVANKNAIRNDGGTLTIKNGTITRTGDVVGYSVNNASGEITVKDATITRGLYTSGSKMTATNANISHDQSSRHAIYAWNCEVAINGGTYHNDNAGNATLMASGSSVVTINGGTFSIADGRTTLGWTSCLLDSQNSAEVVVNDGTYNGGFRVQAGTSMTINGGSFNDCYGSNYNIYGTVTVKGGTYTDDAAFAFAEKYIEEGYVLDGNKVVKDVKVAKVGTTEYRNIDEAIAAWTNNTTLTLLNDVELSDVITLKSTEHHILDLGTYKMTAASGKDAFVIKACGTGDAERNAITIKADATNPGSINAGNKCIVYYKYADGGISGNDRPIIKIEGGIFNASTSSWGTAGIYVIGSAARKAATINISGGTFNCSINGSSKSKLLISGGIFNYSVGSQGDVTALRLISGGKFKTLGFMTSGFNDNGEAKFWIGTSMKNSDVGVYVNDEGYLVVGGPVITEFGDKFAAKATNPTKWSSYLQYSSAADNGLYYTNADVAIKKHGEANVVLK